MHYKKIVGKKVYLSPRSVDDAEKYLVWLNDYEVTKYIPQYTKILGLEAEREYLSKTNTDEYNFAIVDSETDELIGSTGLMHVDNINRTAELGIFIGDGDHLSKGYGSEAIMLLLNYGFNFLNLNNIYLKHYSFNARAHRAYEKCGFKEFGVWKNSHYADGEYSDIVFMNIMKDDFNAKKKRD